MHYLFINGRFPQYSQTFIHDQINAIKKESGAKVTVFARSRAPSRFENSAVECDQELLYARPANAKLVARLALNIAKVPIQATRLCRLWVKGNINRDTLLLALQLKTEPNIAITHFGTNYLIGTQLKKHVFPKMKHVVVFHGHDVSSYIMKHGWNNYIEASPNIDCAIAVNKNWANHLRKNTLIRDIKTVYLGTDTRPRLRALNGDTETFSILFVGRFVAKKGFKFLYNAVKNIQRDKVRPIRVHCIGDGPLLADFKLKAKLEEQLDTFIFYGAKQKSFVWKMMTECDLLVAPSHVADDSDTEGLPVVLMEAMAAGIPIISTFHSGIPELVTADETGLLIDEGDERKLRDAIEFAIRNPDRMHAMAAKARRYVSIYHRNDTQTRIFLDTLKAIK